MFCFWLSVLVVFSPALYGSEKPDYCSRQMECWVSTNSSSDPNSISKQNLFMALVKMEIQIVPIITQLLTFAP